MMQASGLDVPVDGDGNVGDSEAAVCVSADANYFIWIADALEVVAEFATFLRYETDLSVGDR